VGEIISAGVEIELVSRLERLEFRSRCSGKTGAQFTNGIDERSTNRGYRTERLVLFVAHFFPSLFLNAPARVYRAAPEAVRQAA